MSLLLSNRFLLQPQGAFGIDWASPLANGLQLFFDATNRRDVVGGSFGTVVGSKVIGSFGWNGVRASGFGTTDGTSTDDRITLSSYTQKDGPRTQAVWFYARTDGGGGLARLMTKPTVGDQAGGSDGMAVATTTSIRVWRYNSSNTKLFEELADVPTLSNLYGCLVATHDGSTGSGFNFYFNGKPTTSTAATAINAGAADSEPLYIGNRPDLTRCWDGWIGPILQWGRVLSAAEVYQITQNPWQLLLPPRRQLFAVTSIAYSYSRPSADSTPLQWSRQPSGGTHFSAIDETATDPSDYLYATSAGLVDTMTCGSVSQPAAGTSILVNYTAQGRVQIELLEGTTVIKSATVNSGSGTITITSGEWASVTSWPWTPTLKITS